MKLYAIRIFVDDWDTACEFYDRSLKLEATFKDSELGWAEFDVGGPSLGIERVRDDDVEGKKMIGRFLGISLRVGHIETTYEELKARGVEFTSPPEKQPWGGSLAHFKDPAGNILTLMG